MNIYIVTEGQTDAAWLKLLLAQELKKHEMEFFSAGGKSEAESVARSILAVRKEPVILVVDADATEPRAVREQERAIQEALGQAAPRKLWRLCVAVPQIESWLLADSSLLEGLAAKRGSGVDGALSTARPKETFVRLFRESNKDYTAAGIEKLVKSRDLSLVRNTEPVRALRRYIEELAAASGVTTAPRLVRRLPAHPGAGRGWGAVPRRGTVLDPAQSAWPNCGAGNTAPHASAAPAPPGRGWRPCPATGRRRQEPSR